jgi:F-type H+-transporting ATPase subunit a
VLASAALNGSGSLATLVLRKAGGEGGGGLKFPGIEEMVEWPALDFTKGSPFAFNKVALISLIAMAIAVIWFLIAGSKSKSSLVPRGSQNLAELAIEFIEKQVIGQAIGRDGLVFLPFLLSLFLFIFFGNLFGVVPTSHFGANARMANPVFLALLTYVIFIGVGIKHHGLHYFKEKLFPPGVPKALYVLVTPIEFLSNFIVTPFSLAVRLFANSLAGHILLVTFSVLTATLWSMSPLVAAAPLSFAMLVAFTGFELMVAFLQAYIFSLLAAVYIGQSLHPGH